MAIASFEKEWKDIKKNFEKATNKKKPSDKFMGVFNKSSGLTPATAAFDKACDADDKAAAQKALENLHDVADSYEKVLARAAAAETDKTVQAETKVMIGEIENLLKEADKAVKEVGQIPLCSSLNDFSALMKNKINGPRIRDYAKRTLNTENLDFLFAMAKKDYSQDTFDTFIKDGSKEEINIDAGLRARFDPKDLRSAPWGKATDEVLKLFNDNIITKVNAAK
jgi:hypothetical protein